MAAAFNTKYLVARALDVVIRQHELVALKRLAETGPLSLPFVGVSLQREEGGEM